jgi:hypothetical protein
MTGQQTAPDSESRAQTASSPAAVVRSYGTGPARVALRFRMETALAFRLGVGSEPLRGARVR